MQGQSFAESVKTALFILALFATGFIADLLHAGVIL